MGDRPFGKLMKSTDATTRLSQKKINKFYQQSHSHPKQQKLYTDYGTMKGRNSNDDTTGTVIQMWQDHEEREALRARVQEERNPSRTFLHWLLLLFRQVALGMSAAMGLTQCVGVLLLNGRERTLGVLDYALRVYAILFCILAVLNETNVVSLTQESRVLSMWITRGLFYCFIGVLGLSEHAVSLSTVMNESSRGGSNVTTQDWAIGLVCICSWGMIVTGCIYTLMGLLCLQMVFNGLEDDYRERVERARDGRLTSASLYGTV